MQYYRSRWLRYGGLCVVSVLVFLGASLMHERALESAIAEEVQRAVVFADDTMAAFVEGADLKKPLPASISGPLTEELVQNVLTGSSTVRIRIFAREGELIYSTDDSDRLGTRSAGDPNAVAAAADGQTAGNEEFDRVSSGGVTQSLRLLSTYVPLSTRGGKAVAVLAVDQRYRPIADETSQPWRAFQLVGVAGAVVFLELFLLWLARNISAARLASRSGFQPPPGSPARAASDKDAKAAEKHAKAQAALEEQLEALRAQVRVQEEEAAAAAAALQQRLTEAEQRASRGSGPGDEALLRDAKDRAAAFEQRATRAEQRVAEAEARIAELVAEVRLLQDRPATPAAGADEAVELAAQLAEQSRLAAQHDQRARDALAALKELEQSSASVEAARAELDAKLAASMAEQQAAAARAAALEDELADLRAKVEEATDLAREGGRRLEEANAAGDAVREDMKRIASERDGLTEHIAELETTAAQAAKTQEELAASLESERAATAAAEAARATLESEIAVIKEARDQAEQAIGDAEARAKAAESRLAAAASDLSTEAATLAAELDAERERSRRVQERAVDAERRGDEMDKHASTLAQALEDERVQRDQARAEAAELRAELDDLRRAATETQGTAEEASAAVLALTQQNAELEARLGEASSARETAASEIETVREQLASAHEQLAAATSESAASEERLGALTDELAVVRAEIAEQVQIVQTAEQRAAELQAANTEMEQRAAELQAANTEMEQRVAELQNGGTQTEQRVIDLQAANTEIEQRAAELQAANTEMEQRMAELQTVVAELQARLEAPVASPPPADDESVRTLEREVTTLREELDSMGMRLRRAYADAEDARAQLQARPPGPASLADVGGPASADGLDEIQRLRLELSRSVERANAAEARVARLSGQGEAGDDDPAPAGDESDGEDANADEERSLRFRLAKSAARKKGIDPPASGSGWS